MLDQPGSADLSVWVDFSSLRQGAQESGAPVRVHGPVSQASFLSQLGLQARLQKLLQVCVSVCVLCMRAKEGVNEGGLLCFLRYTRALTLSY